MSAKLVETMAEMHSEFERLLEMEHGIHGDAGDCERCYLCNADLSEPPQTAEEFRQREKRDGESLRDYVKRKNWWGGKPHDAVRPPKALQYIKQHGSCEESWTHWYREILPRLELAACQGLRPDRDHCH